MEDIAWLIINRKNGKQGDRKGKRCAHFAGCPLYFQSTSHSPAESAVVGLIQTAAYPQSALKQ